MVNYRFSQMQLTIRTAITKDSPAIASLIQELAETAGETSPITATYVQNYISQPGSHILLAEEDSQVIGLLSFSIHPNLYHAGNTAMVEELVVQESRRNHGVGSALLKRFLNQIETYGCIEASVSTRCDNNNAIQFYKTHGLVDEALLLEKHL